jgi:dTDP-4-dehydrorhamnose 3,5-epimerase
VAQSIDYPTVAAAAPARVTTRIDGVTLLNLAPQRDVRGAVTELCRFEWISPVELPQWNLVRSRARVLRGMHWHNHHHDLISAAEGTLLLGLRDLRRESPTEGISELLELDGSRPAAALVPPGVAHGLYSREPTLALYAVSRYWDPEDELGVAFDDPALGVPWPVSRDDVVLSERDAALPRLAFAGRLPDWPGGGSEAPARLS